MLSSPSYPQWPAVRDTPSGRRQPVEGVGNVKVKNNSVSKPRRRSLDSQDLLTNSPPWPPINGQKVDEKDVASVDWIDKVIAKQHALVRRSSANEDDLEKKKPIASINACTSLLDLDMKTVV
ncbi:hypothetical protein Nepgr_001597 [Nepenthes gracilis]|uniref:Uncharacterized protein n=1 Tax=Nepenthes gracilis TaxID=150966 RepID=A0AAD3P5D6_NEPGR|nr:hypothetical protein Nepgr_001597 [Nepenthes gracilis]